jgi:hypothetical protein
MLPGQAAAVMIVTFIVTIRSSLALSVLSSRGSKSSVSRSTFSIRRFASVPACQDCWRPTIQDVERISWGKPAKQKGTGSRGVPHRLNQEERFQWDLARQYGYLSVQGSAYRSERRDAPLLNSWRSLCDGKAQACIVVHKFVNGDQVAVDLSPLRLPLEFPQVADLCLNQCEGGRTVGWSSSDTTADDNSGNDEKEETFTDDAWKSRPIYQLPPYFVIWDSLDRPAAKTLAKNLVTLLQTAEHQKRAPSQKPVGVKPGKSRRHGGYGIG